MSNESLRIGVSRIDITPQEGTQLAGDIGRKRSMNEVRDRIYATVTLIDDGHTKLAVIAANLLASTNYWSDKLRRAVGDELSVPVSQVLFHVHQNHATPSLGHLFTYKDEHSVYMEKWPWLLGGETEYNPWFLEQILTAVREAAAVMTPVTVSAGRGIDGRVAFNRRFVMRDGTAITHAQGPRDQILYREGPIDPEVGVWRFADASGADHALWLHHSCHPCHGYPHRYVIPDWTGQWETDMMQGPDGSRCAVTLNGCCGNVHHHDHLDPGFADDYLRMAELLSETAKQTLAEGMQPVRTEPIRIINRKLQLPWRRLSADEIAEAEAKLKEFPEPEWLDESREVVAWDWVYAVGRLELAAAQKQYPFIPYEIHVIRLGDLALVGLQGEPFVEGQLEIKLKSPAPFTMVAHFCNGYAGYLPTKRAFAGGGYETRTSMGSRYCEDALEIITQAGLDMLRELFAD
jgi:hypothetical protein